MDMKGTVFQPRVLQLNSDNMNRPLHTKTPTEKKVEECAGADSNPRLEPTKCSIYVFTMYTRILMRV